MGRFALKESGRFALGLLGAMAIAAAVSALSLPGATRGAGAFLAAMAERAWAFLRLDFGTSLISGTGAAQELAQRGPVTATLVLLGAGIALAIGVPLGLLFAAGPLRRTTAPLIQVISAAPVFCAGLALAYAARQLFGWPLAAAEWPAHLSATDPAVLHAVLLPALTVGLAGTAAVQLALRRTAAEAQDEPFRGGLRRLGLSALEIDRVYVAPLVFAGLLASLGEVMLALLSAAVVAEWVFGCPGIADLFVSSVALHDWNMAAMVLFVFSLAVAVCEFLGRLAAHAIQRAAL
jgi:peptide/nickel transport system permease protein